MPSAGQSNTAFESGRSWVRPAAVADQFYPADARTLTRMVDHYLSEARLMFDAGDESSAHHRPTKAIIAPHAGYIYSGPIAASAYVRVEALRGQVNRVVLLGPAHRLAFDGLAASGAEAFDTPLGPVRLDRDALALLLELPGRPVRILDEAHRREHCLEVQLPFLIRTLGADQFAIVPLLVGRASPHMVEQVLDALWGGPETLIVVSSDLSHYHDYHTAQRLDRNTSIAIEALRDGDLSPEQACGCLAIQGLLGEARRHDLCAVTVDLRNSGDTGRCSDASGGVVGYGAYVLS